jgi:hypothetical protein
MMLLKNPSSFSSQHESESLFLMAVISVSIFSVIVKTGIPTCEVAFSGCEGSEPRGRQRS